MIATSFTTHDISFPAFKNKIVLKGDCGFAKSGQEAYIKNTTTDKYEVIVHIVQKYQGQTFEFDEKHEVAGGQSKKVGCTHPDNGVYYTFSIAGESKI